MYIFSYIHGSMSSHNSISSLYRSIHYSLAILLSVQCYSRLHHITLAPSLRPRLARLWTLVTSGPLSLAAAALPSGDPGSV